MVKQPEGIHHTLMPQEVRAVIQARANFNPDYPSKQEEREIIAARPGYEFMITPEGNFLSVPKPWILALTSRGKQKFADSVNYLQDIKRQVYTIPKAEIPATVYPKFLALARIDSKQLSLGRDNYIRIHSAQIANPSWVKNPRVAFPEEKKSLLAEEFGIKSFLRTHRVSIGRDGDVVFKAIPQVKGHRLGAVSEKLAFKASGVAARVRGRKSLRLV